MTAPTAAARAPRIPPGLQTLLDRIDAYGKAESLDSRDVGEIFRVKATTVTSWATSEQLSGLLLSRSIGWRFEKADLRAFATARYHAAR